MAGGSEFRCVELANGIANYTGYESYLLAEKDFPPKIRAQISPKVKVVENCFTQPEHFYNTDYLVIVSTDAKEFSSMDYWCGKSIRHNWSIDLSKMEGKTICFLYNFIASPSRHLSDFPKNINIKIITTNTKFYNEITKQDRYENIRLLPRYILESPIDNNKVNIFVRKHKEPLCFGMHSKRVDNKWNDDILKLIEESTNRYGDKICFRFMGVKQSLRDKLSQMKNVVSMKEDEEKVKDFISNLDVFLFFPDYGREEPWARVIAEAMVSGCPIIALDKGGTGDQVLNKHNGFLCKNYKDYYAAVVYMMEHPEIIEGMSKNSMRIAKAFYSESIINKLLNILKD